MRALRRLVVVVPLFGCFFGAGGGGGEAAPITFAGTYDTAIAACEGSDEPTLEIGLGGDTFAPLPSTLDVEYGSQGGQHVWLGLHATGLDLHDTSVLHLVIEATSEDNLVEIQSIRLAWSCLDDGTEAIPWLQVVLPDDFVGEDVRFELEVTDPERRVVEATAAVHLRG